MKQGKLLLIILLTCLIQVEVKAQKIFSENGKAIRGYDPVAYHLENKAVKGNDSLHYSWQNTDWLFSSAENRRKFADDPHKYAPAYGGFCAYGVSENHLSPTDPNAFTIINDTLYLNYNANVRKLWLKDTIQRIQTANAYWPKLK